MFLLVVRFNWLRKHIGFTPVPGCPDHGSLTVIRFYDEAGNVIEPHGASGRLAPSLEIVFNSHLMGSASSLWQDDSTLAETFFRASLGRNTTSQKQWHRTERNETAASIT